MWFHLLIAGASQNSASNEVIKRLWELRSQSSLSHSYLVRIRKESMHPSIMEQKRIVTALEMHNPDKARNVIKVDIENATEAESKYLFLLDFFIIKWLR